MRYSGDWMSLADDRILEYIREHGSGSPKEMKVEGRIRYSRQHVARRCKELARRGLLEHLGNGVYVITEAGERYLEGELDTQTMSPVEDEESDDERAADASSGG